MKKTTAFSVAALLLLAAACSSNEPTARSTPGTNSTAEPAEEAESGEAEPADDDATTTTTESEPAAPADAQASPYVGGNISPDFQPGEPGQLSVIAVGTPDGDQTSIPFVVRNNTATTLYGLAATGRATDGGQLSGSGEDQGIEPAVVQPGEIAFGYVYFSSAPAPTAVVEVTATGDAEPGDFYGDVPMVMGEANLVPGEFSEQIVGEVTTEDTAASGPINVLVLCVDQSGALGSTTTGYMDGQDTIPPNTSATYSVDLYDPCPTFLVGASGYDQG